MAVGGGASPFGIVGKLFGNAVSSAVGFGAGVALGPVLGPAVREIANSVNSRYSFVFPEPGTLALGVAQGQVDAGDARRWASYHGVGDAAFAALVSIANTGPGVPVAFDLWRRGKIDEAGFRRAAKRGGLEREWVDALVQVKLSVLDPADLARGIHRGLIPDPDLLQGTLPSGEGNVSAYPVYNVDALAEALAAGLDKDHLGVLVGLQGNPMGAHEAAQAYFRAILTNDDYLRAIAEGNTRNEWADAIREQSRQIPTAREFLENALRGYRTLAEALAGAARHGMSEDDATMIYQNQGRPMNVRQITQALARGGVFRPEPGEIHDPYDASIVEGNLKPAYYDLAKALRYTLPSAFTMRQLTASGVWSEAKTAERLKWAGWFPADADEAAKAWATAKAGSAKEATAADLLALYDGEKATLAETLAALEQLGYPADEAQAKIDVLAARRVSSARNAAIADLHTSFKKGELLADAVTVALGKLVQDADAVPLIVAAWQAYRDAFPPPAPAAPA
jgi:hypothetical protein